MGIAAMERKPKSTPELLLEAEEAHREADLTISMGESILRNAREMKLRVEKRLRRIAEEAPELAKTGQE